MVTIAGNYEALANKKQELIRKSLEGSVFLAPLSADAIDTLTVATGTAPNQVVTLAPLPDDWDDVGWLTDDGPSFAREVAQSDITSWGSNTPTRTDITSDTSSLTITMQETSLLTIGLGTGADLAAVSPDATTGEVRIDKPRTPDAKSYRLLAVAVDRYDGDEIYIARFLPKAKVTNYAEQTLGGEGAITWGVTFTGEEDSVLGFSETYLFGGPGWLKLLPTMGFTP